MGAGRFAHGGPAPASPALEKGRNGKRTEEAEDQRKAGLAEQEGEPRAQARDGPRKAQLERARRRACPPSFRSRPDLAALLAGRAAAGRALRGRAPSAPTARGLSLRGAAPCGAPLRGLPLGRAALRGGLASGGGALRGGLPSRARARPAPGRLATAAARRRAAHRRRRRWRGASWQRCGPDRAGLLLRGPVGALVFLHGSSPYIYRWSVRVMHIEFRWA